MDNDSTSPYYFDELYRDDDPFGYRNRWYEQRKRELCISSLPRQRFRSGWEVGCSNGELTAVLGERCDQLLATDLCPRAIDLARARNAQSPHIQIQQANHPEDWPGGTFDLIVLSEIGYYLSAARLGQCLQNMLASLRPEGILVGCHWRRPFEQAPLDGTQVHTRIDQLLGMPRLYRYEDGDFLLEAWSRCTLTPANVEGLT